MISVKLISNCSRGRSFFVSTRTKKIDKKASAKEFNKLRHSFNPKNHTTLVLKCLHFSCCISINIFIYLYFMRPSTDLLVCVQFFVRHGNKGRIGSEAQDEIFTPKQQQHLLQLINFNSSFYRITLWCCLLRKQNNQHYRNGEISNILCRSFGVTHHH